MIATFGLTHLLLAVRDLDRAAEFYHAVFGTEVLSREGNRVHATTPGSKDVITFEQNSPASGTAGGIIHFGFRLVSPEDIEAAILEAQQAGGTLLRRGEFAPGYPFAYVADPDGYEVEIWFE